MRCASPMQGSRESDSVSWAALVSRKMGSSTLDRVDSGWPQEAVVSSDLYSFADTREMDITLYCGDVERMCAPIFRVQKCA